MVRRIARIVAFVGLTLGSLAWAQGAGDEELAPLLNARELATAMATRLSERQQAWPSSRAREVFREYRRWLAQLSRSGLEAEFADEVRARSARMAEIISGRFEELVDECREGNSSVIDQMQELATMASRYPALVQQLGAAWFPAADEEIQRCGVPNWYGVAGGGQADAFATGYYGSVEVTWMLDEMQGESAAYVPVVEYVNFTIPRGECEVYTVDQAVVNLLGSHLVVDFATTPATYRGMVMVDVTFSVSDPCSNPPSPPFRMSAPFPVMFPVELGVLDLSDSVIEGSYEDADTEYQSRWYFERTDRD